MGTFDSLKMAYKYIESIWQRKQSDVMRFILRTRCWEMRNQHVIERLTRPSRVDKARRLDYKAKQGYVVYRTRVRRGGRKKTVHRGIVHGKPSSQGVNKRNMVRSLRALAASPADAPTCACSTATGSMRTPRTST